MGGRSITVSFGVTEIQPGDTPETMLRRADRALLMAKAKGRNTVVQLGSGAGQETAETRRGFWSGVAGRPGKLIQQTLLTPVPLQMAIEKLRGFVADHRATIVKIDGYQVQLEIVDKNPSLQRRFTDRSATFRLDLNFEEERLSKEANDLSGQIIRTKILVAISPRRDRDRRQSDVTERARQVLTSFRSYLMATKEDETVSPSQGALKRATWIFTPWRARK
jgi:hypothetical protein